jgi:hypothetical protein
MFRALKLCLKSVILTHVVRVLGAPLRHNDRAPKDR